MKLEFLTVIIKEMMHIRFRGDVSKFAATISCHIILISKAQLRKELLFSQGKIITRKDSISL